jgi:hypothetical protein
MSPWPVIKMIGIARSGRSQFSLEIETAQSRHTYVEDEACRRVRPLEHKKLLSRGEDLSPHPD